jgi:hypothetical protein
VAYAQLMIAADRLAKETKLSSCYEDAARYKVLALRGIRCNLASFSKENSLGVLAASISMMHAQETPEDWQKVSTGTMAVIEAMRPWLDLTPFWLVLQHIYPKQHTAPPSVPRQEEDDASITLESTDVVVSFESTKEAISFLL